MSNTFLLKDVAIFTGDYFIEDGYVLVAAGKITYVGAEAPDASSLPPDLTAISMPRRTVMPGLIDAHVHGLEGNIECLEQSLRFGVTTVCDMHNDPHSLGVLTKLAQDPSHKHKYADFKCAGMAATIAGGWPTPVLELEFKEKPKILKIAEDNLPKLQKAEDAEPYVQQQVSSYGASYIKLMHELGDNFDMNLPEPPQEVQKAVVEAAHKHGKIAVGHAFSHAGAMGLLSSGVDGLTHVFVDRAPSDDWIDLMKRNKAHLNPTLACCASQAGEGDEIEGPFTNDPFSQRMLFDKRVRKNIGFAAKNAKSRFANAINNAKDAHREGIPMIVGSDCAGEELGTAYGMGVHVEMYLLFHKIGLTALEVLKSATSTTADRFGFPDRGRLGAGKKADMVLVEGDVREAIANLQVRCLPVSCVWRDGVKASVFDEICR